MIGKCVWIAFSQVRRARDLCVNSLVNNRQDQVTPYIMMIHIRYDCIQASWLIAGVVMNVYYIYAYTLSCILRLIKCTIQVHTFLTDCLTKPFPHVSNSLGWFVSNKAINYTNSWKYAQSVYPNARGSRSWFQCMHVVCSRNPIIFKQIRRAARVSICK